jgi:hypothetical protein
MAGSTTGTLNSNVDKSNGVGMALTTETSITLIVIAKTGAHNNHTVCLELSGGNTSVGEFIDIQESEVVGSGISTINHNGGYVKAKVCKPESSASEVDVWIIAR